MPRPFAGAVAGAIAGLAGASALDAVSYADMALRGRPSSDSGQQTVKKIVEAVGAEVPGRGGAKSNRYEGLGPLAGIGVGVGVGVAAGTLRGISLKVPKPVAAIAVGLGAMALSDSVMTALGVTDPRSWSVESVLGDALPHLAYGLVTTAALHRLLDPGTAQVR